jgi:hypothetical protein
MSSVLIITTEFNMDASAESSLELNHYEMLERDALGDYMMVRSLVLVFVVFIIIDSLLEMYKLYKNYKLLSDHIDPASAFKIVTDFVACGMTMAFAGVSMRIRTKTSVPESSRLVGAMSQIKWETTELSTNISFRTSVRCSI